MGWAARNKFKGNYDSEQCNKCKGTGIRGYKLDPFRRTRTPIRCKCVILKEIAQKEAETNSPVSQLAEEPGLEPAQ